MSRFALVLLIVLLVPVAAAQAASPDACLLAYLHPLVETEADPTDDDVDPLDDIANDCRVTGYAGEVKAEVYSNGVTSHHFANVVFFLDPETEVHDMLDYVAVGYVDTWIEGTDATSGCTFSSPVVRHAIPTDEAVDHPMTDGSMTVALWTDPPAMMGIGVAFVDLTVTSRCPVAGRGIVTTTAEHTPAWAWLSVAEPLPIDPDLSTIVGSYTAPGATSTSWSTWTFDLRRTDH